MSCGGVNSPYNYGNVNILAGGSLVFDEPLSNGKIDFCAKSILVEIGGSLLAGVLNAPFGSIGMGSVLTIHLYGKDLGVGAMGIPCKSPVSVRGAPCGIPDAIWVTNGASKVTLPGPVSDRF